ncbi:GntR family transcriptional regulator [Burkholderiaceae bacterium]|nr:GntR family transcriptional regulator [Burkholderiaceae bacterium]
MSSPNLPAESLVLKVAQQLRDMLVEGLIAPGAKLNERELAEACAVSRTPLREAVRMLAAEGLVVLLPNRGAIAVSLSKQDAAHTFEVIAGLEALSGELAAQRITDSEILEIQALNLEMRAAFLRRDLPSYYRLNAQIHAGINRAARNPVLINTYGQVNARLQALRFRSNQDTDKWREALMEHDAMVDALGRRDGPALSQILTRHLNTKRDVVLAQLSAAESLTPSETLPPVDTPINDTLATQVTQP